MNAFHEWLRGPEGGRFVERCMNRQDSDDAKENVSFWEYLLRQEGRGSAALHALIVREDWNGLERKVKSMHRLYLAEQKRDRLYQRVRQVLHDADAAYGYQPGDKFSWYGATGPAAPQAGTYDELRKAGFAPNYPVMETKAIRTADGILQLAATLREQLATHRGEDCRIPLQTLCGFIRDVFDVSQIYEPGDNSPAATSPPETDEGEPDAVARENPRKLPTIADRYISSDTLRAASNAWHGEEALERLADAVACQLEREKLLLLVCLLTYCALTMAQTATALGYAGPSGVAAPYRKAQLLIKEATSLVDGMGEDDLNDDMFHHFLGLLLGACKDGDCSRYAR